MMPCKHSISVRPSHRSSLVVVLPMIVVVVSKQVAITAKLFKLDVEQLENVDSFLSMVRLFCEPNAKLQSLAA